MEGRERTKKIIVKDGKKIENTEIVDTIKSISDKIDIKYRDTKFYRDTYYDDKNKSLLNSGGYLKIRENGDGTSQVLMRGQPTNPEQGRFPNMPEMPQPLPYANHLSTIEKLKLEEPFFKNFDFNKIEDGEPALVCSTTSIIYDINFACDNDHALLFFNYITYGVNGKQASDIAIKLHTTTQFVADQIFKALLDAFPEKVFLDEADTYKRALACIKDK